MDVMELWNENVRKHQFANLTAENATLASPPGIAITLDAKLKDDGHQRKIFARVVQGGGSVHQGDEFVVAPSSHAPCWYKVRFKGSGRVFMRELDAREPEGLMGTAIWYGDLLQLADLVQLPTPDSVAWIGKDRGLDVIEVRWDSPPPGAPDRQRMWLNENCLEVRVEQWLDNEILRTVELAEWRAYGSSYLALERRFRSFVGPVSESTYIFDEDRINTATEIEDGVFEPGW